MIIAQSPNIGDVMMIGDILITITATDEAGNSEDFIMNLQVRNIPVPMKPENLRLIR